MFIHHFRRSLVRRNSCHPSTGNTCSGSPCFLHENLWEPQSDFQLQITYSSKDARASVRSFLRVGVFRLLVSNPSLVAGTQHLSTAAPGGKP